MTVCIAARAGGQIVLASDRLLTAGDIQFEPQRQKLISITNSIYIMTAGDSSFLTLVLSRVLRLTQSLIEANPTQWLAVRAVVDTYVRVFSDEKAKMAETAILAPLGLTRETFLSRQGSMDSDLVRRLATGMLDYQVADCSVIIAGLDSEGTHIFTVEGTDVFSLSTVGFAAIGIGARHANSQFMLARHAWNSNISDTLLLTYVAKRRSEAAPGVGSETDMVLIGPDLGGSVLVGDHVKERLEQEYRAIMDAEESALTQAKTRTADYVQQLQQAAVNVPVEDQADAATASDEGA